MAQSGFTPILTYASNTASAVPLAGNLANSANGAELAVNTADRRLFVKNSGGTVVELGNNPSIVTNALGAAATPSYTFTGDINTGMWSPAADTLAWSNNGAETMRLSASGNLGIGTSSPSDKLHVAGAGSTYMRVSSSNASSGSGLFTKNATSEYLIGAGAAGGNSNLEFRDITNAATRMSLTSGGDLCVGTTVAAGRVTIEAQASATSVVNALTLRNGLDGGVGLYFDNATSNNLASIEARVDSAGAGTDDGNLVFSTANSGTNTERARITSGGDLLVGDTTGNDGRVRVDGTGNANNCAFWGKTSGGATASTAVWWNNTTTGDNLFERFYTEGTATLRGSIDYNRAGGLVRYNTTSDYRAKDIIGPVQNPGATIDALKVYEGKMKGATQTRPMLVAHEAQEVAPYAVSGVKDEVNEDGTPKFQQIDVSSLVPLLLAEIQSLRARVAALEAA